VLIDRGHKLHFVGIGEGPARKEVETCIAEEGMEGHVHLTGFREDIPQLLKELDVFLITSKTEGLGTSILDALASEIPVVATRAGGIVEIVEDGVSGLLCDVGKEEQLADAVVRMLQDQSLADRCIKGGQEKLKQFSRNMTAQKTKAIYEEVLASDPESERTP
jgi:glycosyltransferase involved in cell wall biosynthesis